MTRLLHVVDFHGNSDRTAKGIWRPVVRYDCSHDFAHRDRYNLRGEQKKDELHLTYAEALNLADEDINKNWQVYKEQFLRGE